MVSRKYRTTFSLDEGTAARLKRLAKRWRTSQAEVVRRAVELAEKGELEEDVDPVALLRGFHQSGSLQEERAAAWCREIDEGRSDWRGGQ